MRKVFLFILSIITMFAVTSTALAASNRTSPYISNTYSINSMFNGMSVHNGIDVSQFQYSIDWTKVRNGGTDFAIIRCGYRTTGSGTLNPDPYFKTNIKNANANGVPVGIYFFSQAISEKEAIEEAKFALDLISGYDITLPVIMDFEWGTGYRINALKGTTAAKKNKATKVISAFCDTIEEAGYTPMIYANTSTMNSNLNTSTLLDNGYKLWVAQYNSSCTYTKTKYSCWQYSSKGKVKGINANIDCDFWFGDDEYFKLTKPAKVISLSQSAKTKNTISLKWTKNVDTDNYLIYRSDTKDGTYTQVATVNSNTYKDTGLEPDRNYYYKVAARNSAGTGMNSSVFTAETLRKPGAVTGLSQSAKTKSSILIEWTKNTNAQSYNVYRGVSSTGTFTLIKRGLTSTSYNDTGLSSERTYYYKVAAVNDIGDGPQSDALSAKTLYKPSKVVGLAQSGNTMKSIKIKWDSVSDTDEYLIYRSDSKTGTYKQIGKTSKTNFTDTGLSPDKTYYYKVYAENAAGTGLSSSVLSAETVGKPDKVTNLVQSEKGPDHIVLKWSAAEYASGYNIYRAESENGTYVKAGSTSETKFKNSGLSPNRTYYYKVAAFNSVGTGVKSDSVKASTLIDPVKVTGIKRSGRTVSSVTLSWTHQEQAEAYDIYRATAYDGEYVYKKTVSTNKYTNSGLTQGKSYYYKVVAKNALGKAPVSSICTATVTPKLDRYGKVKENNTAVHKRAGTHFSKIATLSKDANVTIYAFTKDKEGNSWYKVKFNEYTGYIKSSELDITKKLTTLYAINLRKGAGTSYGKYGEVPAGKTRTVYNQKTVNGETWYQIDYTLKGKNRTGWICGYYKGGANVKAKNL